MHFLAALAAALMLLLFARPAAAGCDDGAYPAGFQIVDIPDGPRMAVWYPATGTERSYAYAANFSGAVVRNGKAAACGPFPLVVFSHGYIGCGTQSVFLTEQLARAGYVVAAPDHADALCKVEGGVNNHAKFGEAPFFNPGKWTEQTQINRRDDITRVIDFMTTAPQWRNTVDAHSIGAIGHSAGGYTVAGMLGGWPSWKDERIKAAVLLSPYVQPFMTDSRLANISTPVMYQGANLDFGITPFINAKDGAYDLTPAPKYYLELWGGTHFEWTNFVCRGHTTVAECLKTSANARNIDIYALAFLNRYLKGEKTGLAGLKGDGVYAWRKKE